DQPVHCLCHSTSRTLVDGLVQTAKTSVKTDRPIEPSTVQNRPGFVEFRELSRVRSTESSGFMERAMGIEPTSELGSRKSRLVCSSPCSPPQASLPKTS